MADEPKKPRGRPRKPVAQMVIDNTPEEQKPGKGGAREGAGRKRVFKRIDAAEQLFKLGFDPFQELVVLYRLPDTTTKEKINIAQDLAAYCAPKLKSTEVKMNAEEGSVMGNLLKSLAESGRPKPPSAE